jgi:Tfp pilus assembly protein PilP
VILVALVATLLTSISISSKAEENSNSEPEVLKIWLEPEGSSSSAVTSVATGNDEVFSASDDFVPVTGENNQTDAVKPTIQTIASDQLTLVAVIVPVDKSNVQDKLAMVGYNGHDYGLREGSKVGLNNGYVKEIAETYVIIEEENTDNKGVKSSKEILLKLENKL